MYTVVILSAANGTTSQEFRELQTTLEGQWGWQVKSAAKEGEFSALLRRCTPSLILALVSPSGGIRSLESLSAHLTTLGLSVPIMPVLAGGGSLEHIPIPERTADFLVAPLRPAEVLARIQRVLDRERKPSMAEGCLQLSERWEVAGRIPSVMSMRPATIGRNLP